MNNLYQILDELRTFLLLSPFTNTVTFGEVSDIDLGKKTNFPMVHISIDSATIDENYINFTLNLVAADVVDTSKELPPDEFLGNDNVQDILNSQLKVMTDASNFFRRADLVDNKFIMIDESIRATPFLDKYENELAGWEATVSLKSVMQDQC